MKLLIVTAIAAHQQEVLKLFKASGIEAFSSSEIDGYKNISSLIAAHSWFPSQPGGNESLLFFSFSEEEKVNQLLEKVQTFNANTENFNPIRAAVIAIEKFI
ncbi:MAG: hypothetical protein OQJ96_08320 [Flavobacteriales bacterium]|nr:hypothetical protein [Flavobacteriales bacterium]MCW8913319.1 hypothetical protein [Flavobacteriales bacterium]MCW8938333.1 hypothetical protein [Flavobacteriales bacterium]MCW8940330.1 hypothetical protein [Flavobacteriales bacterium]MCW8969280.1 hypothetical protein [Flavobacteriales bacterium]